MIDASASEVLIRFNHDGNAVRSVAVIDNGQGMTGPQLDTAMAFGANTKGNSSLGKYGMGLKSASFSQCEVLTRGDLKTVCYATHDERQMADHHPHVPVQLIEECGPRDSATPCSATDEIQHCEESRRLLGPARALRPPQGVR